MPQDILPNYCGIIPLALLGNRRDAFTEPSVVKIVSCGIVAARQSSAQLIYQCSGYVTVHDQ